LNEAERYWKLSADPFTTDVENWFFVGSSQRAALAHFGLLIPEKPSALSLVTSPSNGATTLLKHLSLFRGSGNTASHCTLLSKRELTILNEQWVQREAVLAELKSLADHGIHSVWMCDRYDCCVLRLVQKLRKVSALTFIIAMSSDDYLRSEMHLGITTPTVELHPMTLDDTRQFIQQSMRRVDGDTNIFAESAIERLHRTAEGRMGEIVRLAKRALSLAAQECSLEITTHTIEHLTWLSKRWTA